MSLSKVVSFQSETSQVFRVPHPAGPDDPDNDVSSSMQRFRRALQETAPAESLIGQLRDIILGPQARLSEARFEEMLDILEEQKEAATQRLEVFEENLGETVQNAARMTGLLEDQQDDIDLITRKLEDSVRALREEQDAAINKLRSELHLGMEVMSDTLKAQISSLEMSMRSGLLDLSSSLVVHIAEEDKRWESERAHSMTTLEQRIAQWRAEIDDDRREDMEELAASMMDIGKRLMALRKG